MSDSLSKEELRETPSKFVENIIGIEPTYYQKEFMDHPAERKAFVAGRQVGKSRVASWMALHFAVTHPNTTTLVTADALRQSSELFQTIQGEIGESEMSDEMWGIERQTQTIMEFDNGSRIMCVPTGRSGNKIRGFTADMVIVDEAAFIEDHIFEDVLEPMMFVSDGKMVLISTPFGKSGYFYQKATDPNWYSTYEERDGEMRGISSYDNPHASEEKIDDFMSGKTQVTIDQEVYGRFTEDANSFFSQDLVKSCVDSNVKKETDDVYLGVDLARHGTDSTVMALIDSNGNVFSIEEYERIDLTDSVQRVKALDQVYDFKKILVDETGLGAGPMEILENEVGRKVKGETFSIQKKQSIYQTAKAAMETVEGQDEHGNDIRAISLPKDETLIEQMTSMGYNETQSGNLSIHARNGGRDDYVDAVCLAIWASDSTGNRGSNKGIKKPINLGSLRD